MSFPAVEFGSICHLQNGRAFKSSEWSKRGIPIIRIQNLNDVSKPFNYCNFEVEKKYHVKNDDLLFSWSGTPGTSFGAFFWNRGEAYLNQHIFLVNVDENFVSKDYLRRAINSKINEIIAQSHGGVGLQHITKSKLEEILIPLPPIEIQKQVAAILEKADQLRKDCQKMEQELNNLSQSVFMDMFGSALEGDDFFSLGDVADVASGVTKGQDLSNKDTMIIPYMRVANVQAGYLNLEEIKEIEVKKTDVDKYQLKKGDVLLTEGGDFDKLGRGALWEEQVEVCIHQNHVFRVRLNKGRYLPEWFNGYLKTSFAKRYFLKCAKKTTNLASINITQLKSLPIPNISIDEQESFLKKQELINEKIALIDRVSKEFDQSFNSLMQKAFKGNLSILKKAA